MTLTFSRVKDSGKFPLSERSAVICTRHAHTPYIYPSEPGMEFGVNTITDVRVFAFRYSAQAVTTPPRFVDTRELDGPDCALSRNDAAVHNFEVEMGCIEYADVC